MKRTLIRELEKMINDDAYYRSAIEDIHYYSESQYNYEIMIELYKHVLDKMHRFRQQPSISIDSIISDTLSKTFIDLDLCKPLESKDLRQQIYDRLRIMI